MSGLPRRGDVAKEAARKLDDLYIETVMRIHFVESHRGGIWDLSIFAHARAVEAMGLKYENGALVCVEPIARSAPDTLDRQTEGESADGA